MVRVYPRSTDKEEGRSRSQKYEAEVIYECRIISSVAYVPGAFWESCSCANDLNGAIWEDCGRDSGGNEYSSCRCFET